MATFYRFVRTPHMLRYWVSSIDGSPGKLTAADLIAAYSGGPTGPLVKELAKLNAAGSWGAVSTAIGSVVAPNPLTSEKISITLTPYTDASGTICSPASYQFYNDGSNNVLEISGGLSDVGTLSTQYTSAVLEIRFNHSTPR